MRYTLITFFLSLILLTQPYALAEQFVGQWHIYAHQDQVIAQTIDGPNKLQLIKEKNNVISIVLSLHQFKSFDTKHNVMEYHSPTYGLIRTVDYHQTNNEIRLSSTYETKRFIETLKDIASHPLLLDDNLAAYFSDRKLTISFIDNSATLTLAQAKFSTIEIDEVLQQMELML